MGRFSIFDKKKIAIFSVAKLGRDFMAASGLIVDYFFDNDSPDFCSCYLLYA